MTEYNGTAYYFCGAGCRDEFKEDPAKFLLKSVNRVPDPVCGMKINPDKTEIISLFNGTTYYFCEVGCKDKFDSEPEKYLAAMTVSKGCCKKQ